MQNVGPLRKNIGDVSFDPDKVGGHVLLFTFCLLLISDWKAVQECPSYPTVKAI